MSAPGAGIVQRLMQMDGSFLYKRGGCWVGPAVGMYIRLRLEVVG